MKLPNLLYTMFLDLQILDYGQEEVQIYHKQIGLYIQQKLAEN